MSRQTDAGEATVALLCRTLGMSRAAYYASTRAKKMERVRRLPVKPKYTSAEDALAAIRQVIDEEPAWGVRKVWATLRRRGLRIARRRVWALMKANGLVLARDREPGETTRGHVVTAEPNRRMATDLTTVWTKRDGVVAVIPTIDCGCRSMLALTVSKEQDAPAVLTSADLALTEAFGSPELVPEGVELRTDHGPQFTGVDAEAFAARWHVTQTFAPVGRPTGNAVVERVIRTMKEEVVWLQDWESADELRTALEAWMIRYNTSRPHQALDWKTPAEHRAERLNLTLAQAA